MTEVETIRKILNAIWFDKSERDGYIEPETLTDELAKRGYVIIRDPAHAPEAVEAAWKALTAVGPRAATLCEVYHANNVCICQAEARAAITAYIERAR